MRSPVLPALLLGALLAGCPTVDLGDTPVMPGTCRPDFSTFRDTIWPQAIAVADGARSCVAETGCHAQATGRSSLRLLTPPASDRDHMQNYDVVTRFLNCSTPEASPFITKPRSDVDPHAGGDLWDCTGACEPIKTVEEWIRGG